MVPNHNRNDVVNHENPQMPMEVTSTVASSMQLGLDEPPSLPKKKEIIPTAKNSSNKSKTNPKSYMKMPSWRLPSSSEPDFYIGVLIDDTNVKDRHLSAMSKPASRCFLASVVVLNTNSSNDSEEDVRDSVKEWLKRNKVDEDVDDVVIGYGKEGYEEMLTHSDIDAVYIVLSPRYVARNGYNGTACVSIALS
jgi:hypothetical protein